MKGTRNRSRARRYRPHERGPVSVAEAWKAIADAVAYLYAEYEARETLHRFRDLGILFLVGGGCDWSDRVFRGKKPPDGYRLMTPLPWTAEGVQ